MPTVAIHIPATRRLLYLWFALALLATQGCQKPTPAHESHAAKGGGRAANETPAATPVEGQTARDGAGMVLIKTCTFLMGAAEGMPFESPVHEVAVDAFWIDEREVTVAAFAAFVAATGYQTEAEKFGWSGVFNRESGEWERVDGADWRHPDGPATRALPEEPVCQVSWQDAAAYAAWAGKRLPTEAEWEYAARGGLSGKEYAWGDDLRPGGRPVANWWQGRFPERDTGEDGFAGRAPAGSFRPNGYGLYDMAGNVWEWCADWYAPDYYARSDRHNPAGPEASSERVIRGGSWMCAENFCSNYRVAARSRATPDSGLNNLGFRCACDA